MILSGLRFKAGAFCFDRRGNQGTFFEGLERSMRFLTYVLRFFARLLDMVVCRVITWKPFARRCALYLLQPLIMWRMKDITRILEEECELLNSTTWDKVEKNGCNVVYATCDTTNVFDKFARRRYGIFVVNYKNKTMRIVNDPPTEYLFVGSVF